MGKYKVVKTAISTWEVVADNKEQAIKIALDKGGRVSKYKQKIEAEVSDDRD